MAKKLEVTLKRSTIGRKPEQRKTVEALGLKKIGQTVVQNDNDAIRGMVGKVSHLVEVKEVEA
ncbi:50S ribosomal protein L30 [Caldalkalibacillus salinus]|uniref:50S ribosomal protein L30 n=1 Tax=Caldalkalibacillus salinus TaxID=2803787 RepID=UPI0019215892